MAAVPSYGRASGIEPQPLPRESAAAGDLYTRYSERIFRFCFNRLRSREEAEDATQTTFLNAFRGLRRGVTPEVEQAWLYKIAENVCLTRVRSNVRRFRVESPADLEPLHELVAAPERRRDELHGIGEALSRLPDQQRRAILLREWQGLSYKEIGDELGLSQGAVETLIFRARRSLARQLERGDARGGRLRKGSNIGSLAAWLKSLALGGSTAIKVAAVIAAGSAVIAAGVKHPARHAPAPKPDVVAPARRPAQVAPARRRHRAAGTTARTRRPAHASTKLKHASHPALQRDRRVWPQRVENDPPESAPALDPAKRDAPPAPPGPAQTKTRPERTEPPPEAPAPPKDEPKPQPPETKAPRADDEPAHGPQPEAGKRADDPSAQAPGQLKDKPKKP